MAGTNTVTREAVISASPERIHEELTDFHNWPHWSPWEGIDPDMTRNFTGPDSGVGSVYEWSGNKKAGAGRMELLTADPRKVVIDLNFLKPFKSHSSLFFDLVPEGAGTKVTWTMVGPKTLGSRVMTLFGGIDKLVGKDFEKGLRQLQEYVGK
jgi:uncharacterized protein YndB with AHSA1/START domain